MGNYNRITFKERVRIEAGIYAKKSFSQIAKELGRSTSSITREVKQENERARIAYFERKPTYEQWCSDIMEILLSDPDCSAFYDKERIESDMDYYSRDLHHYFDERESPKMIAGQWSIITM